MPRCIHHSGGGTQALCLGRAAGVSRPYAVSGGVTCTQALPSCELRPEPGPPGRPPHPPAPSYRPRPRPGPRSHWSFRHPRQCLPGLPSCPLVRPGPPRKFEKKKKSFMGGWKGPGQLRGREGLELRRPAAERGGGLGAPRSPARESRAASSGAAMTVSGPGWNPARLGTECRGSSVQTCPLGSLPSSPRGARAVEGSSH